MGEHAPLVVVMVASWWRADVSSAPRAHRPATPSAAHGGVDGVLNYQQRERERERDRRCARCAREALWKTDHHQHHGHHSPTRARYYIGAKWPLGSLTFSVVRMAFEEPGVTVRYTGGGARGAWDA